MPAPLRHRRPTLTDGVVTLRAHREDDCTACSSSARTRSRSAWTTCRPYSLRRRPRLRRARSMPGGWADGQGVGLRGRGRGPVRRHGHAAQRGRRPRRDRLRLAPGCAGTGAMERAAAAAARLGLRRAATCATVIWRANVGNWASRRLAWRLGFSFDGTLRQWLPQRGELRDALGRHPAGRRPARAARGAGSTCPVLEGDGVRLRPSARRTPRGSSRRAATSGPGALARPTCPRRTTEDAAVVHPGSHRGPAPGGRSAGRSPTRERRAARLGRPVRPDRRPGRGGLLGAPRRARTRGDDRGRRAGARARPRRLGLRRVTASPPSTTPPHAACSRPTGSCSSAPSGSR